ncbi:MAG: hypothetical protein CL675_10795 [Bdellovibrionaceae bacterium]|nr:hypothetical protein [Pseudobdellovibrionaceae bacterium]
MKAVLLFAVSLMLIGCSKGPKSSDLKQYLDARLKTAFGNFSLEVSELSRRGSYSYKQQSDDYLLVYYKADLLLQRDIRFSDWNQMNAGSLVFETGAAAKGISGIRSEGNRAGDHLIVHGTMTFKKESGRWELQNSHPAEGQAASATPSYADNELDRETEREKSLRSPLDRELEKLKTLVFYLENLGEKKTTLLAEQKLISVRQDLQLLVADKNTYTLASGPKKGEYKELASGIADVFQKMGSSVLPLETQGSVENLKRLDNQDVDFALVQSDVAGRNFLTYPKTRAVASLFPEALHILMAGRAQNYVTIEDLRGRDISIGPNGSGSNQTSRYILEALGMKATDFTSVDTSPTSLAIEKLLNNEISAVFYVSAYPSELVRDAMLTKDLQLLSLTPSQRKKLSESGYFPVSLPRRIYPVLSQDLHTVGVTTLLATHAMVKKDRVRQFETKFFELLDRIALTSVPAKLISAKTAKSFMTLPPYSSH